MQSDDSRNPRDAEAYELRMQKEMERQDNIRRKVVFGMNSICHCEVYEYILKKLMCLI